MITACITTRNEQETIGPLVSRLLGLYQAVIVVDDASADQTAAEARASGAHVTVNAVRMGMATSILSGWGLALSYGASHVVQIDAGGSHDPADSLRMLSAGADIVIGSRFVPGARYTGRPWRAWMSRAAAAACNWAQRGARWHDWTSGYRAYSAKAMRLLMDHTYLSRMHGFQIETLALAGDHGLTIAEVPISYQAGRSAFNLRVAGEAFAAWFDVLNHRGAVRA